MAKQIKEATTINRISDKAGNFLFWAVKSNSSNEYYAVRCKKSGSRCFWYCDCKAAHFGYHNCKNGNCSHINSVISAVKARVALRKEEKALKEEQEAAVVAVESQLAEERAHVEDDLRTGKFPVQADLDKCEIATNEAFSFMAPAQPVRVKSAADRVVQDLRNAPRPRRQQEEW